LDEGPLNSRGGKTMRNKEGLKILRTVREKCSDQEIIYLLDLVIEAIEYNEKLNRYMWYVTLGIGALGVGFLIGLRLGRI
jgi:hypothetical protein